ncbi:MAG: 3-hydroxyacyl-CoA dehydrogenase family protein [Deltaproteobacteria bacterium]|nr:3-hydroxyacyl-CoA dehydrogenase family protein [Deltaproteobacteria bacterium]
MSYQKLGIVGSGLMGTGIAFVAASRTEAETVVVDVAEELLKKSRASIEGLAARAVEKGQAKQEEAGEWLKRLRFTANYGDLEGASFVIEAVPEDLALKRRVFADLDRLCSEQAVLASNTTGLPITQIASATRHPERVIGAHFFNPAPVMKLVEIVRGYATSEETIQKTKEFCSRLGKETILVEKDYTGFVTTRIYNGYLVEALHCLEEGIASASDIDKACKLAYNHPMGPFELMDLVGLETVLSAMESLHAAHGERFRPSLLLRQMVAAGRLGRKSGSGFYSYVKKEKSA